MRTIELTDPPEAFEDHYEANRKAVDTAVGYLTMWARATERYQRVKVYFADNGDITAVYHNPTGEVTYSIGAVWRGSDYSFHS